MYYLGYGSNMNLEHMRRLCGWHFTVIGAASVAGFELGADTRGFATIREKTKSKIYGVLYEVDKFCMDALDEFEGYPDVFNRIEVTALDEDGDTYVAWAYCEPADQFGGTTIKESYLRLSIVGARENHLPETWIKFLENFQEKE